MGSEMCIRDRGKIVRSIPDGKEEINLMRKTTLGRLASATLDQALGNFDLLKTEHGFDVPEMTRSITGPVVQVIPIAIFA